MVNDPTRVTADIPLATEFKIADSRPEGLWITRPIAEDVSDAMEQAPIGHMEEIVYAVVTKRLKQLLDGESPLSELLSHGFVPASINFRSLNSTYLNNQGRTPASVPNTGAGSGGYHAKIWGPNHDQRLPHTIPLESSEPPFAIGQNPEPEQNKGLLIAKLFEDLQHHLPCVLFNIVSKTYVPMGIGGGSVTRKFMRGGQSITEIGQKHTLNLEALVVSADHQSTATLQIIVETAFGALRDQIGSRGVVSGNRWQLTLPVQVAPDSINETDAPWSQGDDKGAKIYTGAVQLLDLSYEAFGYVGRTAAPAITASTTDAVAAFRTAAEYASGVSPSTTEPIRLRLGESTRLVVTGEPMSGEVQISQDKRILGLNRAAGVYELVARRVGEATLWLYDTGFTLPLAEPTATGAGDPVVLTSRHVVVTAT